MQDYCRSHSATADNLVYHTKALSAVKSPVTKSELNDWVRGIDDCDPMLDVALKAATSSMINYLELELLTRERLTTFYKWPIVGTPTDGLSGSTAYYKTTIEIPYANLITMDAVLIDGQLTTDYRLYADQRPALIDLSDVISINTYDDEPAIQMQYQAGFGGADDVPESIKIGIMMLAGYIYDKRGACDMSNAMELSGASAQVSEHKVNVVNF